jgi:hypothetical protein
VKRKEWDMGTSETELVEITVAKDVLARFRAALERRGISWERAWYEAAAAWANMDEAECERREAWLELGEGLGSGPSDSADRHDDYIYGPR